MNKNADNFIDKMKIHEIQGEKKIFIRRRKKEGKTLFHNQNKKKVNGDISESSKQVTLSSKIDTI